MNFTKILAFIKISISIFFNQIDNHKILYKLINDLYSVRFNKDKMRTEILLYHIGSSIGKNEFFISS